MNMRIKAVMVALLTCVSDVSLSESSFPTNGSSLVTIHVNQRWTYQQLFASLERWGVTHVLADDQIQTAKTEQKRCTFTADFRLMPKRVVGAWIVEFAISDGVVSRTTSHKDSSPQYLKTILSLERDVQKALHSIQTLAVTNIIGHQAIRFMCQKAGVSCVLSVGAKDALTGETTLDYANVPLSDVLSNESQRVGVTWSIQTGVLLFIKDDEKAAGGGDGSQ